MNHLWKPCVFFSSLAILYTSTSFKNHFNPPGFTHCGLGTKVLTREPFSSLFCSGKTIMKNHFINLDLPTSSWSCQLSQLLEACPVACRISSKASTTPQRFRGWFSAVTPRGPKDLQEYVLSSLIGSDGGVATLESRPKKTLCKSGNFVAEILLMAEILHHLGCMKP